MGASESRDLSSIFVQYLLGLISLLFHFVFVIVSDLFDFWRSRVRTEGLQSELEATNKDGDAVRKRLLFQDSQLERLKERQDLSQEEEQKKYGKISSTFLNYKVK